jgi:hypothetical protein
MAAFTSKATGNWSSGGQTTWNQVGVPGNGDTVIIGTGHAITVNVNTTVGHSPGASDATAAVLVNTTGTLTVAAGIVFTVRGDLKLNDTTLTLAAGSVLEFDASAAGTPSTARYVLQIGTGSGQTNVNCLVNGTSGSRCTIRSNAGGANARVIDGGFSRGGQITATFCDFTRLGDSANSGWAFWGDTLATFSWTSCVADACGPIVLSTGLRHDATFILDSVTFKNSVGTKCASIGVIDALTTGARQITGTVFDKTIDTLCQTDFTITNTVFYDGFQAVSGVPTLFSGNLLRISAQPTLSVPGSLAACYVLMDHSTANPHGIGPNQNVDYVIDGCAFEYTGTDGTGDCILPGEPGSAHTTTVTHCLALPNAGGNNSGTLVTLGGNANLTVSITHNTYFTGIQGVAVGETYAGRAGLLSAFKNNLAWDTSARGYKLYDSPSDNEVNDLVAAANCDYNGGWNLLAGNNGKGYNDQEFSSGNPGDHDVSGDPQFVDATRNIAKWDLSLGGAGTVANALTELRKRNDAAGYNASYTIAALLTYVRAGFAPQSSSYQAADDNVSPSFGWIGAVQGQAVAVGPPPPVLVGVA